MGIIKTHKYNHRTMRPQKHTNKESTKAQFWKAAIAISKTDNIFKRNDYTNKTAYILVFYTDERELIVLFKGICNENVKDDRNLEKRQQILKFLHTILHKGDTQIEYIALDKEACPIYCQSEKSYDISS